MKRQKIIFLLIGIYLFNISGCKDKILTNSKINSIYFSSINDLWIGTSNGIYMIKDGKYKDAKDIKVDGEIRGIAEDSEKNIYFGNKKKIICYNKELGKEEKIIEPTGMGREDSFIQCLAIDKNDNLWIGRYNDLTVMSDGKNFKTYPIWDVIDIDFSESGEIWLGAKSGLYCIKNGGVSEFNQDNSELPAGEIKDILVDNYDNLWLATNNGLVKYNRHIWIIYTTENSPLKDNRVTALYSDKSGSLIVGMESGDLESLKNNHWQGINLGLKDEGINTIFVDLDIFLLGTNNGLLVSK